MSATTWIGVALLSGVGAVLRFSVHRLVHLRAREAFPTGTLIVNLSGALVAGTIAYAGVGGDAQSLVSGGLLGSYTTFSTWMLDSERLATAGRSNAALANMSTSVALGLAAVLVGRALAGG